MGPSAAVEPPTAFTPPPFPNFIQRDEAVLTDEALSAIGVTENAWFPFALESATEEDRKVISSAFESYSTAAANTFKALNLKIGEYSKNETPYHSVQNALLGLNEAAGSFHECLSFLNFPKEELATITSSAAKVDNTLEEVSKTFEVSTQPSLVWFWFSIISAKAGTPTQLFTAYGAFIEFPIWF